MSADVPQTPTGLEANHWTDADHAATPEWAKELLEIAGVNAVTKKSHGIVAVDTDLWFDEDGVAEPHPELLSKLSAVDGQSLGGWSVQQVTVKEDGNDSMLRIRLGASTPVCRAKGCYNPATHEIDNVLLDGSKFQVYACDDH
jgi:hypothetical protein